MSNQRCFEISQEEGEIFAHLSGDFNPLHLDSIYARRLQFGDTVVHGVHHMLRAWDALADSLSSFKGQKLMSLRAKLLSPVKYEDQLICNLDISSEKPIVHIAAEVNGVRCLILDLEFSSVELSDDISQPVKVLDAQASRKEIVDQLFPPSVEESRYPLYCDNTLALRLFPKLSKMLSNSLLAQIMACTQFVGMTCPGLNSVFTGITLFIKSANSIMKDPELTCKVLKSDKRFARIFIAVEGPEIDGKLEAFFRPSPVLQPTYREISEVVAPNHFKSQRALIIGGSRGAGEVSAKILAAGGADICVTYFKGDKEARSMESEVKDGGGMFCASHLDVLSATKQNIRSLLKKFNPTHIYFFATPKIEKLTGNNWNQDAYEGYCKYYMSPIQLFVDVYMEENNANNLTLFYPSSIYIDEPRPGFAEYAAAKKDGEDLCRTLEKKYASLSIKMPRLPTMITDQTTSIIPIKASSAADTMLLELEKL